MKKRILATALVIALCPVLLAFSYDRKEVPAPVEALFLSDAGQLWIRFSGDLDAIGSTGQPGGLEPQENWFICSSLVRRVVLSIGSVGGEWIVIQTIPGADCGEPNPPSRVIYEAKIPTLKADREAIEPFELEVKVIGP